MRSTNLGLQDSLVTVYGDTTKTFITDKVKQKVIDGKTVLGPSLNQWFPVFDDVGLAPNAMYVTPNNRVFFVCAITGGLGRVVLYDFDPVNGTVSFVGSLILTFINSPATTHTIRGFCVNDGASPATVTNWQLFIATTGSITANGGVYMAGSNSVGVNKSDFTAVPATLPTATVADAKQVYKLENSPFTLTQAVGMDLNKTNTKLYLMNGVSATYQVAIFSYTSATGIPAANGIITTLTDGLTANLPAVTGTLLLTNCLSVMTPTASPNPVGLLGSKCLSFMTSSNSYMGLISDLSIGGTTWTSLTSANYINPLLFINPTPTTGRWVESIDRWVMNGGVGQMFIKAQVTNSIDHLFGGVDSQFLESGGYATHDTITFGGITTTQIGSGLDWVFVISTATSQRGAVGCQITSRAEYEDQYIITKVLDTKDPQYYQTIASIRVYPDKTLPLKLQYRTSGFASETVGWIDAPDNDLDGLITGSQVQFRILFYMLQQGSTNPAQIEMAFLNWKKLTDMSENWVASQEHSTREAEAPAYTAFRQVKAHSGGPVKLYFRAVKNSDGSVLVNANTVDHFADFSKSSNSGGTFTAMTGANDYANVANTTEIRYEWSMAIGDDVTCSLCED